MMMTDIRRVAESAARHRPRPIVMVDNTFLGRRFSIRFFGATWCSIRQTKYLSGFSDMLAGVRRRRSRNYPSDAQPPCVMFGNILQPDECWMLDGRLPTVSLRMNRQSKNAQRIAEHRRQTADPAYLLSHHVRRRADSHPSSPVRLSGRHFLDRFPRRRDAAFTFLRNLKITRDACRSAVLRAWRIRNHHAPDYRRQKWRRRNRRRPGADFCGH
jgi:cystathionine beta-lyase/cystathionine gamma-synthase